MLAKLDTSAVLEKMEELCNVLLKQEAFKQLREMIDQFAADEEAVEQYDRFVDKQRSLHQKEHQGLELSQAEMDEYEQEELALYDNSVIRQFMYAQREFTQLHSLVSQYFVKTVELDRIPELDELSKGGCGCGGNCGCGGGH